MFRGFDGKEISTVYVDAPEFLHTVVRVGDCVDVFAEAGRGDEVVYFAVFGNDFGEAGGDGFGVGDVGVVGGYFWDSVGMGIR